VLSTLKSWDLCEKHPQVVVLILKRGSRGATHLVLFL